MKEIEDINFNMEKNMDEVKEKICSYHKFLFPFIWENAERKINEKEAIERYFENNGYWKIGNSDDNKISKERWINMYSRNEYFHPAFRNAVLGYDNEFKRDKSIVSFYEFAPEVIKRGAEYVITKSYINGEENGVQRKEYHLEIAGISIKIFNTGVAVLILECLNHQYQELQDIKWINDYGRRISLPFIPQEESEVSGIYSICADSLTVRISGADDGVDLLNATESFADRIQTIYRQKEFSMQDMQKQSEHVCNWISALLEVGNKGRCPFTGDEGESGAIRIHPALDERMYVMCLINSGEDAVKKSQQLARNSLDKMDKSQQEALYELAYVDANSCTCQSDRMRVELLQKCTYDRWINYGTIYTITPQAFLCISSDPITMKSFCNMYIDMCVLSLVQRATLINFQDIALGLSKGLEKVGNVINTNKIKELMDLQERFIAFQNQINLQEISSQEQAVELYKKLIDAGFVEELTGALKEQLDALYDATNTNQNYSFNKWALLLAITAIGIDIPTFLFRTDGSPFFLVSQMNWQSICTEMVPHAVILFLTVAVLIYFLFKFNRRGK